MSGKRQKTAATRKPSQSMIAGLCGVSKMTVSRVFRNDPRVAPGTRTAVLDVASEVNYLPSRIKHAQQRSVHDYTVLFQEAYSLADAYFSEIIRAIQKELFANGRACSFGVVADDYPDFLKLMGILRAKQTRGCIVVGSIEPAYADALQSDFWNLVLVDYPGHSGMARPFNAVYADQVRGAHLALRHLKTLGRKRILLLCGKKGHYFSDDLLTAYRQVMTQDGGKVDRRLILNADFHREGGRKAVKHALKDKIAFDAILSNDEMACGAVSALRQAGLRVPEDVAIVGFDDLPVAQQVHPTLTTVRIDRNRMGTLAVQRLLAAEKRGPTADPFEKLVIFPELVVRESCGAQAV